MATILLSNDDGFDAPGLAALADGLASLGRIIVVAPDREQSGSSHSLTLHQPLRVKRIAEDRYRVEGTPTDCIHLAVLHLMKGSRPDLVVSGINRGYNLGDDVTYSGTVAAALEALLLGVPSIAMSRGSRPPLEFGPSAEIAMLLARQVLERGLPRGTFLNVNVPPGEGHGFRVTRQGRRVYGQGVIERLDPKGRAYYWVGGEPPGARPDPGSDLAAVARGEVSVTPLHGDWTNHAAQDVLGKWELPFAAAVAS